MIIYGNIEYKTKERSIQKAVKEFKKKFPNATIEQIGENTFFGFCEICGKPIVGSIKSIYNFYSDSEGIVWCKKHGMNPCGLIPSK